MHAIRTVLMTADSVGGVLTYAIELGRELTRREVRVALAVMGGPLSEPERASVRAAGIALFEGDHRLEWMEDPWEDVARAGRWLLDLEALVTPDVVHLGGLSHGALPFRAPRVVVAHSCVTSWFEAVERRPAPAAFDRYRREVRAGLAAADAVVAPSRAMMSAIVRHHGAQPRGRVILNGRDPARFRPSAKDGVVLSVGRAWDRGKNMAALSAAAPSLPWPVRVAGSVIAPDGTRAPLAGLDHLGVLSEDDVAAHLARAAVYAAPARYEPFGLAIVEAALCRAALVLGDIPSLRELWDGAALFVDPDDTGALVGAIRALIDDPRARATLAGCARSRALGYASARMAEGYLGLYRELVGRSRRRPAESARAGARS